MAGLFPRDVVPDVWTAGDCTVLVQMSGRLSGRATASEANRPAISRARHRAGSIWGLLSAGVGRCLGALLGWPARVEGAAERPAGSGRASCRTSTPSHRAARELDSGAIHRQLECADETLDDAFVSHGTLRGSRPRVERRSLLLLHEPNGSHRCDVVDGRGEALSG